jgi:acetolactate synthase-1/2/3 large subunit
VIRWRAWSDAARADFDANRASQPVEPLDMAEVVRAIDRHVPAEAVFTNGAGNFAGWLHRFHRYAGLRHAGRTQLAPTSGAMGYGLPAAVAAALLAPERTVVNIAGDGDFLMTAQEMATAIAYGAKRLVSIVVDNGSYGTIRMHQERVDATRDFEPALVAALASGRPALIHVKLATDVITSRTTLSAIRSKAEARRDAERTPNPS